MESHKRKARRQSVDDEVSKISAEVTALKKRKLEAEDAAAGGMSERERQDVEKKVFASRPDMHLPKRNCTNILLMSILLSLLPPSRAEGDAATTEGTPHGSTRQLRRLRLLQLVAAGQHDCI
jgi:hypothetical protein